MQDGCSDRTIFSSHAIRKALIVNVLLVVEGVLFDRDGRLRCLLTNHAGLHHWAERNGI
jgi:hypothetical protein